MSTPGPWGCSPLGQEGEVLAGERMENVGPLEGFLPLDSGQSLISNQLKTKLIILKYHLA